MEYPQSSDAEVVIGDVSASDKPDDPECAEVMAAKMTVQAVDTKSSENMAVRTSLTCRCRRQPRRE
jgi:hypothetical protein